MATTDNKIINGSGLSKLSSQIKSYVNDKTEISVGATAPTDNKIKLWVDTSATGEIAWNDITGKPDLATKSEVQQVEDKIPTPYTLPKATTSTLGGVMPDGNTITIADGVISAVGSGGGEPDAYIKDASVSGNTLTLTKKDDTNIVFTPSGGSSGGGGDIIGKTLSSTDRNDIPDWIPDWCANPNKYAVWIDDKNLVFATNKINMPASNNYVFKIYWIENNQGCYSGNFNFTDSSFTTIKDRSYFSMDSILLTTSSYQDYIPSWVAAESGYDSNLYNAKELVVYVENTQGNKQIGYFNFGANSSNLGNNTGTNFYFDYDSSSPYIYYDGSFLSYGNANNLYYILYKT